MKKNKFMVVSGFLGAGKTTVMIAFTEYINKNIGKAAIIANDLGSRDLVDADYTSTTGCSVTEIAGGCICYQTENLVGQIRRLRDVENADIVMSDIPGCGVGALDHVYHKLNSDYSEEFELAPFTVIVDPERLRMIMPEKADINLPKEMMYLLNAQLQEADIIVLNKIDILSDDEIEKYLSFLKMICPDTPVFAISARKKINIKEVVEYFMSHESKLKVVDLGYGRSEFLAAESKLSWYNRRLFLKTRDGMKFDCNAFIDDFIEAIRGKLIKNKRNIPHLKIFAVGGKNDFGKASLIGTDYKIEYDKKIQKKYDELRIIINIRAACESQLLAELIDEALNEIAGVYKVDYQIFFTECFGMTDEFEKIIHTTESLCPVCLKKVPARHVLINGDVYLQKTCDKHGDFSTIVWRGQSEPSYDLWKKNKWPICPQKCLAKVEKGCPYDCGLCDEHKQQTCCALIEVTQRCNLNCSVCFAESGGDSVDPSLDKIREWLKVLVEAGRPFVHISGGEPTVRDDLPEIIRMIKEMDFPYIQLNTNGLRLAQDPKYVKILKEAGLSSVFMQFDGTKDEIYRKLRGRNLLAQKEKAIENCGKNNLGIVLVPTIVPEVNADNIGDIVRFGLSKSPAVRGIHFQPVSYFGRYPAPPSDDERITLPEVIREIENQTGGNLKVEYFSPSGCDHARCGFHGDFVVMPDGSVKHLTIRNDEGCCCSSKTGSSGVERNRNFVKRRWVRESSKNDQNLDKPNCEMDEMDIFLDRLKSYGFTITGMAFQDCWNIDLERLHECSLHVVSPDGRIIPFCAYNVTNIDGKSIYRGNV